MRYFLGILSTLLLFLVVWGVLALLRRPRKAKGQTVVWSKGMLVIGLLGCGLWLLLALWGGVDNDAPGVVVLCLVVSFFLGGDIILGYFNCRVAYREEGFTVRNFWGVKRAYTYDQITGIQGTSKSRTIRLHVGGKVVKLEDFTVGREQFLAFAKKQYRKGHNGEAIPVLPPKKDLFNGNVENPEEQIAVFLVVAVVFLAVLLFFLICLLMHDAGFEGAKGAWIGFFILTGMFCIWLITAGATLYIQRNVQKFSKKFLKFLGFQKDDFREGVWRKAKRGKK